MPSPVDKKCVAAYFPAGGKRKPQELETSNLRYERGWCSGGDSNPYGLSPLDP